MNRNRTISITAGAVAAAALIFGGVAGPAAADKPYENLTPDFVSGFQAKADELGVEKQTAKKLLAKLDSGQPLDSSSGAEPVSTTTTEEGGFAETRLVYADGSVVVTGHEIPVEASATGDVTANAVAGCQTRYSAGVKYGQNCYVYASSMTMGASFYASYSQWSTGSEVYNWHTPQVNIVGGSMNNRTWYVRNSGKAIQLFWNYNVGGVYSQSAYLQLNTSSSSVWETHSLG